MGMTGQFIAVSSEVLQAIKSQELSIHSLEVGLDIDKSWQALHYVLCGSIAEGEPPLGYIIPISSNYIGHLSDVEAFALNPGQIREALAAVEQITAAELREQYNFAEMVEQGVYPLTEDDDSEEFFDYIYENFVAIRDFYTLTAAEEQNIIFYIL
ncbi:YfbM family protein [Paenibacillus sp. 19GGS1-52]|uniref:YfbM family protein n=1 Tax=Paenibacillus sp. 19GGS1-52 TaxID=2758563 RepID=UPI001EFA7472|nr:YfbM family protein [Paenibacillus sp. 19GGS1-52]ULO05913.1 YfbM family protein [Paenibacillus sp. 19GGS1-52]